MIKESDWKRFSRLKETALDRYCERALANCRATMEQEDQSNHERFLDLYQQLNEANERLAFIFDGHARSKALYQFTCMRREGLIEDAELEAFTTEFVEQTRPQGP
ncbi:MULTISPECIES: hypothetical protein [unclassified Thioalkalivibrio]|uniref:hypothetical protein n=1 Tax=unclassified Thioalkalivibrio TaxID=2621013 RepID=UPI000361AC27|nr:MULTISPECIES: hypothetical protein [unclassified Thioalkalivibrio]